ncbi:hypothetical protein [Microbispora hainanensis]|uniref:hypothetical protein n=1 Tax=Microbispora hainanensis TaxID=568844 RepID=UPI00142F0AD8|nr:hypothetical protein [Microbispora hainanensis]
MTSDHAPPPPSGVPVLAATAAIVDRKALTSAPNAHRMPDASRYLGRPLAGLLGTTHLST